MSFAPFTTKPTKELDPEEFLQTLSKQTIKVSSHAGDHLSSKQRNAYTDKELINVAKRKPNKVYQQANGRYKAYYRLSERYQVIIYEFKEHTATIVTFMDTKELPRYEL